MNFKWIGDASLATGLIGIGAIGMFFLGLHSWAGVVWFIGLVWVIGIGISWKLKARENHA
jgi:hypothetical protein